MEKKGKVHLTNEKMSNKFKSGFELVNYAIKLAENMIKTGRDSRVKSDVQNRAMLILEEIYEGKDHLDEIQVSSSSSSSEGELDDSLKPVFINEERLEKRKFRAEEMVESE